MNLLLSLQKYYNYDILIIVAQWPKNRILAWDSLLKARAIENSAWIIAPAQVACHKDGRKTYGHSLVVNPNGEVVLNLGAEKCQINYEINFKKFAKTEATYLVD